ncbi:MAG TPA: DoxX family membrane protein [Allosphingosinicella sp.]|nr:DoxX family membrane protein [Allosphingosinicella sp.]
MIRIGANIYGAAALLLGAIVALTGDFVTTWQPVPEDAPGHSILVFIGAALLIGGGLAVQWPRTRRAGGAVLALVFLVFALLWARRILGFPQILGTWLGTAEELAVTIGGCALFLPSLLRQEAQPAARLILRIAFGLCALLFGAAHFVYVKETAALVPGWLPPNATFWAYATGAGHVAAGAALVSGLLALLAARLLTLMFLVFQALVWLPQLFQHPDAPMAWGGNGVNLALVGAAWLIAELVEAQARTRPAPETE